MNVARLAKIKKLAETGKGGEREAAQRILEDLVRKYDVDPALLLEEELVESWFTYQTKHERLLLVQIIHKILNVDQFLFTQGRKCLSIDCTQYQADMILVLFFTYRRELAKELTRTVKGFIHANRIYNDIRGAADKLTPAQVAELVDILKRAAGMTPVALPVGYIGSGKGRK